MDPPFPRFGVSIKPRAVHLDEATLIWRIQNSLVVKLITWIPEVVKVPVLV